MDKSKLVIGQVVSTNLYNKGKGVIYSIHGEQNVASIRNLHGVISIGGSANFDIVFYNGSKSKLLPESILYGVQWHIHDEFVSQEEINVLLENAQSHEIKKKEEKDRKEAIYKKGIEDIINNHTYTHLNKVSSKYDTKEAIKNIRLDLKINFPGIKFSVRMSKSSVYISWGSESNITKEVVGNLLAKFKTGSFDTYEDIHKNEYTPFNEVFGSVDYISLRVE
ncbi:LPD29 domain-containing protein [Xenorhabdus cabanillasii]|uniref:Large polyvalent protein associated domain-containing protein n=1 Tax=Xenorhabdus cabanillasii JM26 TaxID=1427517 RepID=W1J6T2_9GAMM|nr:LPD29 domain-containing protein [Xenorhabdus cabanillasii]PHM75503.1 hypothetical protein Xcab_04011 [Xenorhabdus cabanillasii JM26]CDL86447.1 conserved hypothetical protein [Xenorhabdus cabanillasii JM26]